MESDKKDSSDNLPSESGEVIKAFEKKLERLENLVKLLKCDVNKPLPFDRRDISDSSFSSSSSLVFQVLYFRYLLWRR
jgi:hypothetical protein